MGAEPEWGQPQEEECQADTGAWKSSKKVLQEIGGETERDLEKSIGIYRNGHQGHVYLDTAFK